MQATQETQVQGVPAETPVTAPPQPRNESPVAFPTDASLPAATGKLVVGAASLTLVSLAGYLLARGRK